MKRIVAIILCASVVIGAAEEEGVVGITVDRDFKVVKTVIPDGPAAKAGVRVGDQLIAVDGFPTAKMGSMEDFAKRVRGAVGSEIDFELRHPDSNQSFHIRVQRAPPKIPPEQKPGDFDPDKTRVYGAIQNRGAGCVSKPAVNGC